MDKAVVIYKHFQEISLERSFNNQVTEIRKINIIYNILKKGTVRHYESESQGASKPGKINEFLCAALS